MSATNFEKLDIKFIEPFAWGALHVTEAAGIAYDLSPVERDVTPKIKPGTNNPRVNFWMLAPGELPEAVIAAHADIPDLTVMVDTESKLSKKSIDISVGLSAGIEKTSILMMGWAENEISKENSNKAKNIISDALQGRLFRSAVQELGNVAADWYFQRYDTVSARTLAYASVGFSAVAALKLSAPHSDTYVDLISAGVFCSVGAAVQYRAARNALGNRNALVAKKSLGLVNLVSDDMLQRA